MKKRVLGILLSVIMVFSVMPMQVQAEGELTDWGNLKVAIANNTPASGQTVISVDDTTDGVRTVKLLKDIKAVTGSETISVTTARQIILDLNGHVIDGKIDETNSVGPIITVVSGASLTLVDGDSLKTHSDGYASLPAGGVITGGEAVYGGGVYNGGTFVMNGGTISGCSAQKGGGVFTYGNMTMSGNSAIRDCTATIDGGGVCACNCAFSMADNSVVSNCVADNGGGGVYTWADTGAVASFTMSGNSEISNCSAKALNPSNRRSGGGVCVEGNNCTFTMSGGSICGNNGVSQVSVGCGGSVNVYSGTFTMNGGSITNNTAATYCAGVFVNSGAAFNMSYDSVISNNNGGQGAGVYSKGTFTMSGNSQITGNTGAYGGGVGVFDGTFTMSENSKITYNTGTNGGGLYVNGGSFKMTGSSTINHNTASGYGGVFIFNGSITLGDTAKITDNVKGGTISGGVLSGGTPNNVCLMNNKYITLGDGSNGAAAPTTGFCVGVTTLTAPTDSNPVAITSNGSSTDTGYYISDDTGYVVKFDTDKLVLAVAPPHTHHLVKVDGQAATKTASGWNDYYECMNSDDACHKYFEEENGTTLIENLETWKAEDGGGYIAPLPYTIGDLLATVENFPTTAENGWINENNLKMYFADEKLNINGLWTMYENLSSAVEPSGSNFVFSNSSTNYTYTFVMENNVLTKVTVAYTSGTDFCGTYVSPVPENYTVTFDMKGHGNQIASQTVAKDSTASQPANPSASGWTFAGWYSNTGLTEAYDFSTPITANTTLYAKWTQNTPTPDPDPYYPPYIPDITPEPTKDPEPIAEPVEDYIVPVESDKDTVQVSATIEGGIATVDEITGDVLEDIIEKKTSDEESDTTREATDSVTIDLSEAKQDVTGAELSKKSVETLSDVVSDETNNLDSVVIKMKEASVELDAKTLETLHESMAGDTVKLVVDKISEKGLNENQKSTLSNCNVARTFEAYFESNGEKIHDFKGGTVKVSVSFKPEKGKNANNYKAYYLDEKGVLQKHVTKYENGRLTFLTGHFSNYVIIYDNVKDVLLAQAATTKKGYIKLSWNEIDGAVKYVVYGAKCGNSYNELAELDAETDGNVFTIKKINGAKPVAGKTYKLYVVAYDALGNKIKSKSIHYIAGDTSAKYANVETITPLVKTLEMTVGEKVTVGAEYTMYEDKKHTSKKHGKALRFTSNCAEVAKVSSDGTVTAKSEGKATIYIQDISGKWCKVEVTVKEK